MSVRSATVEALTAEVRVLMVGSRQITLSVVRQLDKVAPELIEPFGRVRAARQPALNEIEVVGSLQDGILAYSTTTAYSHLCYSRYDSWCEEHQSIGEMEMETLNARSRYALPGDLWEQHHWYSYTDSAELWEKWAELPLIVLAGLR
jgi:hypothetical protein